MLLLDTDMLVLLLASGTMECVVRQLGYNIEDVRRLPAAIHQVRKSSSFRNTYGEAVLQQIAPLIERIPEVPFTHDLELLDTLCDVVDVGEAQLMALAAENKCALLASGDKRAINDLAGSHAAKDCLRKLQGRIICLEAVLWMLVNHSGAQKTREAFSPVMSHRTLKILLSEHAVAQEERCLGGILSYFNDLAKTSDGLLYNPEPDRLKPTVD